MQKTDEDAVNIIAFKDEVLISALGIKSNNSIVNYLPECIRKYFLKAESMIETSIET